LLFSASLPILITSDFTARPVYDYRGGTESHENELSLALFGVAFSAAGILLLASYHGKQKENEIQK
jgi:hypothetical protein